MGVCQYCGGKADISTGHGYYKSEFVTCEVCGRYAQNKGTSFEYMDIFKSQIATYLYYHKPIRGFTVSDPRHFYVLRDKDCFDYYNDKYDWVTFVDDSEVAAFNNKNFSEKVDNILIMISKKSKYIGEQLKLSEPEIRSLLFVKDASKGDKSIKYRIFQDQIYHMAKYLNDNGFARFEVIDCGYSVTLLPEGWKRVDKVQNENTMNKNVFVSMAFNNNTVKTREAIRNGIKKAEYSPAFIDEIIHNKQIVPEMFRLIRESRFLILDITEPNYGAYYEAGYALGLGKEVIICCSKEVFNKQYLTAEEKKYEKYLRPHFDIAQKQILVWNDEVDLTTQLSEWIKYLFN